MTRLESVPSDDPTELAKGLPVDLVTANAIADALTVYELRFEVLARRDQEGNALYSLKFAADKALCEILKALHMTGNATNEGENEHGS